MGIYLKNNKNDLEKNTRKFDNALFDVCYNPEENEHSLLFIHGYFILYYKINDLVYFRVNREYYLILGNVFITVLSKKTTQNTKGIYVQIDVENEKPKRHFFKQSQCPIKIGRSNCDINIKKICVSKFHSVIDFCSVTNDFYYKDMGSTNGSTLLLRSGDSIKLRGEMHFKLQDIPFKVSELS